MMRILSLICVSAALVLQAAPRGPQKAPPEDVGLSSERLARATAAIEADVAAGRIPGAVGLVARRGKVAYFEARGEADREAEKPMRRDTIFRIYSMSKPITTTALMMLHEEGKFQLRDPLDRYLPEYADMTVFEESPVAPGDPKAARRVPAKRPITVQDLMRHTAGLTYGIFGNAAVDKTYRDAEILSRKYTVEEMSKRLGRLPLLFHPGEKWHYSVAVDVQGRLIEVLSGQRFDRFVAERIFQPLGMVDTAFWVPAEKRERFAQMYAPTAESKEKLKLAPRSSSAGFLEDGPFYSGGGGLVSTTEDYRRFAQMMLNEGELDGVRLLGRKTVELMTRSHTEHIDMTRALRKGFGFGLGVAVHTDPEVSGQTASVGAYGWGGAAGTRVLIDPAEDLLEIYMVQILPHNGLRYGNQFQHDVYQAIVD